MPGDEVSSLVIEALMAVHANSSTPSLAYCELYVGLVALVLRVFPHLKLFETTVEDIEYDHDLFVAGVKPGSKGVRVTVN
jgi:hypothetical protein